MIPKIHSENGFEYVEEGTGPVLIVLHGLFGALSNFKAVLEEFSNEFRVVIPLMPIYAKTHIEASVPGLTEFVEEFVAFKKLDQFSLLGNSLGGHVALVYTLRNPSRVSALILTGSSGLFESGMGSTFPRRGSYQYVKERVAFTFFSPKTATKELVDEVFEIVNDNYRALRILKVGRSAQRHNMSEALSDIKPPSLLVWGLNDNITPPRVAHEFNKLIPNSELHFIDKCGHAAMMERPVEFNQIVHQFLRKHIKAIV